ncbi:MAG: translocation/assembly module TamB domain-containing protein [Nitrospirota bacterium]|jgi:hypothetical protein
MAKILLRLLSALGIVLLATAYLLSWDKFTGLFREEIAARLGAQLGTDIDFASVRVNFVRLRVQVEAARLELPAVGEAAVRRVDVDLAPGPLLHGEVQLRRLRLVEPRVAVAELRAVPARFSGGRGEGHGLPVAVVEVEDGAVTLFDFEGANALLLEGIDATLRADAPPALDLRGTISRAQLTFRNIALPPAEVTLDLGLTGEQLQVRELAVASRGSRLRGEGELVVADALAAVHGEWRLAGAVDMAELRCLPGQPDDLRGTLHLKASGTGPLVDPTVTARVGISDVARGPLRIQSLAADVAGSREACRITGVDGVVADARIKGAVDVRLAAGEVDAEVHVADLRWAQFRDEYLRWRKNELPDLPIAIAARLDGTLRFGRSTGITFDGELGGDISGLGLPAETVADRPGAILNQLPRAAFQVGLTRTPAGEVLVRDGTGTIVDGVARVSGRILPGGEIDLAVALLNADSRAVAQLLGIELSGVSWADGRVTGSGDEWRFDGDVHGTGVSIYGEEMARVEGCLHLDANGARMAELNGRPAATSAAGQWVRGDLQAGRGVFELALTGDDLPLDAIHYLDPWPFLAGRGRVAFAIHGPAPLRFTIDGTLSRASAWGIPLEPAAISLVVAGDTVEWQATAVEGSLSGSGQARLSGNREVRGEGGFRDLPLARLARFLPSVLAERGVEGVASGHYRLSGDRPPEGLVIAATVDDITLRADGRQLTATTIPVAVVWRDMGLEVEDLTLAGDGVKLTLSGRVGADGDLQLAAQGDIAVQTVGEELPWLSDSGGMFSFFADIAGTAAAPDLSGGAVVDGLDIPLPGLGLRLGDLSGEAIFSGGQVLIDRVHSSIGGGTLAAEGFARLEGAQITHLVLDGQVTDITVERFGARGSVSGELQVRGEPRAPLIAGDLIVGELLYDQPIKPGSLGQGFLSRESPPGPGVLGGAHLDLRLRAPETIQIHNNLLDLRLGGEVNLVGPVATPGLLGTLTGSNGIFHLRDRDLRLNAVSVTFIDPEGIVPILDVQGDTVLRGLYATAFRSGERPEPFEVGGARNYYVTFMVSGPTDDLTIRASSNPPLEENLILAALMGGTIGGEVGEAATDRILSLVTGGLRKGLGATPVAKLVEEPIERLLSFDRIDIDPFAVSRTNVVSPRLTLGKDLSERLALIYSTSFIANEEPLIELQYRLSDAWQLLGNKNEIGSLGADLRYEFRF